MCSRYGFVPEAAGWVDFRSALGELAEELLAQPPRARVAPTDRVPIVVQGPNAAPHVLQARWGFIPHWWTRTTLPKTSFNARSEEAADKPMWRDALRSARCLIPATQWIEWQKFPEDPRKRQPHRLHLDPARGFMFAGLWSLWQKGVGVSFARARDGAARPSETDSDPFLPTCAILTMPASPGVAQVHDRMPVVLAPEAWKSWLDPSMTDAARAREIVERHSVRAVVAFAVDRA